MKKVYISLPITGVKIEDVRQNAKRAAEYLKKAGYKPVIPFEVLPNEKDTYEQYMGKDIEALLKCDAVLFLKGWQFSKGCQLERYAAMIYNKEIILPWEISDDKVFEDITGEPFRCGDIVTYDDMNTTVGVFLCSNVDKNDSKDVTFCTMFGKTKFESYYHGNMIYNKELRLATPEEQNSLLNTVAIHIQNLKAEIQKLNNKPKESRYPDRLDTCDAPSEYRPGRLSDKEEYNCNQNKV